ncbi:acetolactate synthase small subunit [Elizabethkingia sp. JS20170427COW]|uniref:acetolactate synthase small subunit n=1 Tax=Elizabethkingia sp. JS20170427COW TaxID=2583851 RepID=UPI00143D7325|nr:acetolactate synthase small subunit [Elizabethkingia sp. JS20170427COW]
MEKEFTLSIYTENTVGVLGRICAIFTRRKLNIESISAMNSETPGLFRFTIVITSTEDQIYKVAGQLEKQVDITNVNVFNREEIEYKELAIFKVDLSREDNLMDTIKNVDAKIITMGKNFATIEVNGKDDEIDVLRHKFQPGAVVDFVRSGRIAISKKGQHAHIEE